MLTWCIDFTSARSFAKMTQNATWLCESVCERGKCTVALRRENCIGTEENEKKKKRTKTIAEAEAVFPLNANFGLHVERTYFPFMPLLLLLLASAHKNRIGHNWAARHSIPRPFDKLKTTARSIKFRKKKILYLFAEPRPLYSMLVYARSSASDAVTYRCSCT